jgi:ATP-dependent DNA helicase RecG
MVELLTGLRGVGDALAAKLQVLGLRTVEDLVQNIPRRYEDYSQITSIDKLKPGTVTIQAEIKQAKGRYARRGLHITEAVASDTTGSVRLVSGCCVKTVRAIFYFWRVWAELSPFEHYESER